MKPIKIKSIFWSLIVVLLAVSCADKDNPVIQAPGPTLLFALDATLDGDGTLLAETITSAALSDTAASIVKTAAISNGYASFDLEEILPGDYFITVNGLAGARMPTRIIAIQDTVLDALQYVSRNLNSSVILVDGDTLFRIKTFFSAQGNRAVRRYSNGDDISPQQYAYAIGSTFPPDHPSLEIRADSTARVLLREMNSRRGNTHSFNAWVLGNENHGVGPAGDPDLTNAQCRQCHSNYDMKPMQWRDISPMRGFCFKCHYGSAGPEAGFIDPQQ